MGDSVTKLGRPKAGDYSDPASGEINDAGLTILRRSAGMGLTQKEMAALIGMSERTLYDRRKEFPAIQEVIELGEAEAGVRVANALLRRAEGGDMAAIRWYEMTRKGRHEKVDTTVETRSYVIEVPAQQSEEAWEKINSPVSLISDDSTDSPL